MIVYDAHYYWYISFYLFQLCLTILFKVSLVDHDHPNKLCSLSFPFLKVMQQHRSGHATQLPV